MGEHDGIFANIGYYEDLLRASPQDPRRPIIERLLAKEYERLRERADAEPCPLRRKAEVSQRSSFGEDNLEGSEDRAQRINNADPARHRSYGSLVGLFLHSPLAIPGKISH
jgi:hypothetical protein